MSHRIIANTTVSLSVRRLCCAIVLSAALSMTSPQCAAQSPPEPPEDHSCTVHAAGAFTRAFGKDGKNFNTGWGFQAGGGFAVSRPPEHGRGTSVFITANFMFDQLGATTSALEQAKSSNAALATATSARGKFYATTLDPTFRFSRNRRTSLYLLGGFGWFGRAVDFSGADAGTLTQSAGTPLGKSALNSGVFDAGAGVNVSLTKRGGPMLYAELRVYHGVAANGATSLLPFSLGIRW
jgi:hypothetical protein